MERLEQGESPLTVLHDNGAAMIITTATTIAGFACLGFASFRGMLELGLVGSVGIIVALGASLHLLPVIHAVLVRPGRRRAGVTA
jgi:predicted RND superfamily exporter protein